MPLITRFINYKISWKTFPLIILLVLCNYSLCLYGQTKTNLDICYTLVDSAAQNTARNIPADKVDVKLDLGSGSIYSVFNNRIIESMKKEGKNILPVVKNENPHAEVSFIVDRTSVNYSDLFQQNIFGDFYTKREISLSGSYIVISPSNKLQNFSYSYSDTVNVNDIKSLENNALPFTQGKVPTEPLFSSIYEPVIAIGAAALTVILFFTIRSK